MNTKADTSISDRFDVFKWVSVTLLLIVGTAGFYYFAEHSLLLRVVVLLILVVIATFIASKTEKGNLVAGFLHDSHLEVRKVVWPTYQETVQMTGIVLFMVLGVAVVIWGLDSILMALVRLLTGQGD
jgi:preprotein translocase subunit SecE